MFNIINLNKHAIVVQKADGTEVTFPGCPNPVEVKVTQVHEGDLDGIPIMRNSYGQIQNLPEPVPGTVYIVNSVVLTALGGSRMDVVSPDTGPTAIRFGDEAGPRKGQVKAVVSFVI